MEKILVTGACGQLGSELTADLQSIYGTDNVIATDIVEPPEALSDGPFERLDVMDRPALAGAAERHGITTIYHLAALLSAKAEQQIGKAWDLNMQGLLNVLELARDGRFTKVFWPSSIAVFGPDARKEQTPQNSPCNPTTVYGISKLAGEQWCSYYHRRFGVDVRSLRYPGLIGYKSLPGGGTTDYAVDIFYKALAGERFSCFLESQSRLPMMYMEDAVKATIDLMRADPASISVRTSYNLAAISFTPEELAFEIQKHLPEFEISYEPDYRQQIAESWPDSIDDTAAREDWEWSPVYDLEKMVGDMLKNLEKELKQGIP